MENRPRSTDELLRAAHEGSQDAKDQLFERYLPWIWKCVRDQIGDDPTGEAESGEIVNDVAIRFLGHHPDFFPGEEQFKALLRRMVASVVREQDGSLALHGRSGR